MPRPPRVYGFSDCVADLAEVGDFSQMCSPMAAISIWFPQSEHVMDGRKLAGLIPPLANVAARAMFAVCCEVVGPRERNVKKPSVSPVCSAKA